MSVPMACSELLAEMVAIDSVNSVVSGRANAERELGNYLEERAKRFGLAVSRMSVPGHADNLFVTCEKDPSYPWLLFESHMDTVGVEEMTINPFNALVQNGRIHGRGACDTKGSGAAMLWALNSYSSSSGGSLNVALLLTVDEESARSGINAFIRDQLPRLTWQPFGAIVGEPTRLRLVTAHRGAVRLAIRTQGVAAHSADPTRGRSAIRMMLDIMLAFETRYIPSLSASHVLTGPAVCSINLIRGGSQINIIPPSCEIQIDRRTVPGEDAATVLSDIKKMLMELQDTDPHFVASIDELLAYEPLDPSTSQVFAGVIGEILEGAGLSSQPIGVGYGSHAGSLASAGIPSLVFGPGDIAQAHTADEWLDLGELQRAAEVYLAIMNSKRFAPGKDPARATRTES